MILSKWISSTLTVALLAGTGIAAETVSGGKIKSINAENKTFVLTDGVNKDFTFKFSDDVVVNRGGKEGKSDLKAGDNVSVCYDKGIFTWAARYILVQEGTTKDSELTRGNVKSYDVDKKELTFTNQDKKDSTYGMGEATVRVNMEDAKIDTIRIGDHALLIVNTVEGKATLRSVMVDRAK